jgi:site-specific recombinase XerD
MIGGKPILQLVDEFLSNHQGTPATKMKYRDNLHVFINWLIKSDKDPHNVSTPDIINYIQWLRDAGRNESTVISYIVSIRLFFSYLETVNLYKNVAKSIKAKRKGDQIFKKKPLNKNQVTLLLSSIDRSNLVGKRDYAFINLMLRMGLRCVEICRLDVEDFYLDSDTWLIRIHRKGSHDKNDIQGTTLKVIEPLQEYFSARGGEPGPAFINHGYAGVRLRMDPKTISRIVKERLKQIQINDPLITAHSLRHTAAVTAIKEGCDLYYVSSLLGHKDIKTTMIYLRYIQNETKREAVAAHAIDKAY